MFEALYGWNKQLTALVGLSVVFGGVCFADVSVALGFVSAITMIFVLVTIVVQRDGDSPEGRDVKTVRVAMVTITTLALFTLAIALAGVPSFALSILSVITGAFAYLIARVARNRDDRFSAGIFFVLLFPFGFIVGKVAMGALLTRE